MVIGRAMSDRRIARAESASHGAASMSEREGDAATQNRILVCHIVNDLLPRMLISLAVVDVRRYQPPAA